jgi:hypothetical protein
MELSLKTLMSFRRSLYSQLICVGVISWGRTVVRCTPYPVYIVSNGEVNYEGKVSVDLEESSLVVI